MNIDIKLLYLLFASLPSTSHSKLDILLRFCFLSVIFQGYLGRQPRRLNSFFIPVISRRGIDTVAFSGDYEKYFFPRQLRAFCFK